MKYLNERYEFGKFYRKEIKKEINKHLKINLFFGSLQALWKRV